METISKPCIAAKLGIQVLLIRGAAGPSDGIQVDCSRKHRGRTGVGSVRSDAGLYSLAVSCFAKKDRCVHTSIPMCAYTYVSCFAKKDQRVHTSIPMCAYTYVKPEMDQGGRVVIIF